MLHAVTWIGVLRTLARGAGNSIFQTTVPRLKSWMTKSIEQWQKTKETFCISGTILYPAQQNYFFGILIYTFMESWILRSRSLDTYVNEQISMIAGYVKKGFDHLLNWQVLDWSMLPSSKAPRHLNGLMWFDIHMRKLYVQTNRLRLRSASGIASTISDLAADSFHLIPDVRHMVEQVGDR